MKSQPTYLTEKQLEQRLKRFKSEMIQLMEDFAMYGAWMADQHHTYYPKSEVVQKLYKKRNRITASKKFKKEQLERSRARLNFYSGKTKT